MTPTQGLAGLGGFSTVWQGGGATPAPGRLRRGTHPLEDPAIRNQYDVRILVNGQARPFYKDLSQINRLYVGLRPGETFSIEVANKTDKPAFVRTFVDGMNVLGAKYQLPDAADPWFFPAKFTGEIDGWCRYTGADPGGNLTYHGGKFVMTDDVTQSIAVRESHQTQRIGEISVSVYEAHTASRATGPWTNGALAEPKLAVSEGVRTTRSYTASTGDHVLGQCLMTATIHYIHVDSLADPNRFDEIDPR